MITLSCHWQQGRQKARLSRSRWHFIRAAALVLAAGFSASAYSQDRSLVFVNANVWDPGSGTVTRHGTVLIKDGKIASVTASRARISPGARYIDARGMWMLPGLIDAHVHLADPHRALMAGVTTARNLGGPRFGDVEWRELHRRGDAQMPDVLAAGYQIVRKPADNFFAEMPELNDLRPGPKGPAAVRRVVRALAKRGVDVIKILATERSGLPGSDPLKRMLNDEEIAAIVDEAAKQGLPVAAHAHSDDGVAAAVRAGVRTIEHGTYASVATLALMKARHTCLVPTFAVLERDIVEGGPEHSDVVRMRSRSQLPVMASLTRRAWRLGVPIVAGSDVRYDDRFSIHDELRAMVAAGMPPAAVVRSATFGAAECLSIQGRTGSVRRGLEADLIVVRKDPRRNVEALRNPAMVINDGAIAIDNRQQ